MFKRRKGNGIRWILACKGCRSDVLESPSRYNDERTHQCPKKTPDVQGFCLEGIKSKDTTKLNEPIAHWTRLQIQQPSKQKGKVKFDTEVREIFLRLIDENKELRKQIKDIDLMLKKVLEQQSLNANKFHGNATELLLLNDSQAKAKNSTHTSKEEPVKPF